VRIIHSFQEAASLLQRQGVFAGSDVSSDVSQRIKDAFGESLTPQQTVQRIVKGVSTNGDSAILEYTRLLDNVELRSIEVPRETIKQARKNVSRNLIHALELAAKRIWDFHTNTVQKGWYNSDEGLGEIIIPLDRVGIYAPGGTASYPSSVLMGAIPARVAGVQEIIVCTPPGKDGLPHPATMVAAEIAGVDRLFAVGGAQAVAAMAYGTESVPKVDKVCGPGNLFVALAKKEVVGQVDIDGLYGPTETMIIADETANPRWCAADLLAQAEHDVIAQPVLVTNSEKLAIDVSREVPRRLGRLDRRDIAGPSVERNGLIVVVESLSEAFELGNLFAPEHLCLMLRDPWTYISKVRHAGGVFIGEHSPEVMGDFVAGPSHTMPTGGTARFASYLGVHHFLRPIPVIGLSENMFHKLAPAASTIARAEGLLGHALAIEVRMRRHSNYDIKDG
jgi:histidinol dehydrogenase